MFDRCLQHQMQVSIGPTARCASGANRLLLEEYTYEQQRERFSLGLEGSYGKVGSTYIKVEDDGKITLAGEAKRFKEQHRHEKYWGLVQEIDKITGVTTTVKHKLPFIDKWMDDQRMDAKYLPDEDKDKRYYWDRFDMFPDKSKCPPDVCGRALPPSLWKPI